MGETKNQIIVWLPGSTWGKLKTMAAEKGVTDEEIVAEAVEALAKARETEVRKAK